MCYWPHTTTLLDYHHRLTQALAFHSTTAQKLAYWNRRIDSLPKNLQRIFFLFLAIFARTRLKQTCQWLLETNFESSRSHVVAILKNRHERWDLWEPASLTFTTAAADQRFSSWKSFLSLSGWNFFRRRNPWWTRTSKKFDGSRPHLRLIANRWFLKVSKNVSWKKFEAFFRHPW